MIDRAKLNYLFNALKELVGEQGAFVLILSAPDDRSGEDFQIRMHGPTSRRLGALSLGGQFINDKLREEFNGAVTKVSEPD